MLLSLIHSKSDPQCQWSALLTLFVIASRFSIPHSLHHGSRLSCFTSFLIFLPQQCVRGLCCGCKQGRGMCTFRRLENKPRTPTVTSNWLCVCLGPALPRPASSNHLAELWKLVFPPSLPGWDCLQEVVISFPVAGRKVVCSTFTAVREVTHAPMVGRWEGWLTLPDSTSKCWVASPGVEVSTMGKKGHEERRTSWCQDAV